MRDRSRLAGARGWSPPSGGGLAPPWPPPGAPGGRALADVEAVEGAGLAGRALVTYGRADGRPLAGALLGVGSLVHVRLRREERDDEPAGVVAGRARWRLG